MPPNMRGGYPQPNAPPPNNLTGDTMEPCRKHTYICGSDEWITEDAEVSIAANSFAKGGAVVNIIIILSNVKLDLTLLLR